MCGAAIDDVISKLTAEQALKVVERLARKGGEIQGAVATEVMTNWLRSSWMQ